MEECIPNKFYIQALNVDEDSFDLFEASFDSYEEAQEFLNNFMNNQRKRG